MASRQRPAGWCRNLNLTTMAPGHAWVMLCSVQTHFGGCPPHTRPLVPALTFQRRACLDVPAMDGGRCVTRDCQSQRRHASMPPKEFDRLWFIWSSSAFVRSGRRAYSYLVEQLSTQIYNRRVLQPPASEYISAKPPLSSLFHAFVQQSGALAF
jgi:hypothetical protein